MGWDGMGLGGIGWDGWGSADLWDTGNGGVVVGGVGTTPVVFLYPFLGSTHFWVQARGYYF